MSLIFTVAVLEEAKDFEDHASKLAAYFTNPHFILIQISQNYNMHKIHNDQKVTYWIKGKNVYHLNCKWKLFVIRSLWHVCNGNDRYVVVVVKQLMVWSFGAKSIILLLP